MIKVSLGGKEWRVELRDRIKHIREHRNMGQEDLAAKYGNSQQAWSKRETNEEAAEGMPLGVAIKLLNDQEIDARFLFGQIESIEDSDRRLKSYKNRDLTMELLDEVKELRKLKKPQGEENQLLQMLRLKPRLQDICDKIKLMDDTMLAKIEYMIDVLILNRDYDKSKKDEGERVAGEQRA